MSDQDLTQGNIRKELWSLAWPMMLSVFFYTLYNLVDAYWVSKLSANAIAAVSISQITLFVMISLGFGISVGSGVIMAMHIGAKNIKEAERILGQSFVLSAMMGVFFTIVALVFRNQLLTVSGASGSIFAPALEYYTVIAGGSILMFIMFSIMFAFNSQGDTHTLTKLFAISTLVNVVLDPLLIFGWGSAGWRIPALGITGAAYATLISQLVLIVLAIRSLMNAKRHIRFHFSNLIFNWQSVKKVLDIGFPASLTQVIFPIGIAILTYITSQKFWSRARWHSALAFAWNSLRTYRRLALGLAPWRSLAKTSARVTSRVPRNHLKRRSNMARSARVVLALLAPFLPFPLCAFSPRTLLLPSTPSLTFGR